MIYVGRPKINNQDESNRLKQEIEIYDLLDFLSISYLRMDHHAIFDMEELKEVRKELNATVFKNLFLCNSQQTKFYLLLMPGDKPFKTKELSKQINSSRLSFGKEDTLMELLKVTSGSVNILSLKNDIENKVQLLIDEDCLKEEFIGLHPMINTSSLSIKKEDIISILLPYIHHSYISVKLVGE